MTKSYQTCGKFDSASKKISVYTNLPKPTLNFTYRGFFNLSTDKMYIILGNLVDDLNIDYSKVPSHELSKQMLNAGSVDLTRLDETFSSRKFDALTDRDTILFLCWHDNEFMTLFENYKTLGTSGMTPDFITTSLNMLIPKVGDGGILTATGSCAP